MNIVQESCLSFINSQRRAPATGIGGLRIRPAVTISRQTGCGALLVAEKLARYLQQKLPLEDLAWTVFDRDLMSRVLADHNLPAHLARMLPEDRVSELEDMLAEIFQVRPPVRTIVQQTSETMLQLADCGGTILIGRAGNIITARLANVLHVRLVAPLADRIARICATDHLTPAAAHKFCAEEDAARARYVKGYFKANNDDPLQYHLVINTSRLGHEAAAQTIGEAVVRLSA